MQLLPAPGLYINHFSAEREIKMDQQDALALQPVGLVHQNCCAEQSVPAQHLFSRAKLRWLGATGLQIYPYNHYKVLIFLLLWQ